MRKGALRRGINLESDGMSTGRDELLMAVVNHDIEHPEFDELSNIGDGQHLCSVAADLIHELRQEVNEKQDQILELVLEVQDIVNNPPHFWFGDSAEVDGDGEDHEGWLCWEHGDSEAGILAGWALDGSSPMANYIRSLEERVEKCVYDEDYQELEKRNEQLEEQLRRLGACPDCGQVAEMDEDGPFSSCACGTGEDYGRRPLQQLQLMQRIVQQIYGVAYPKQKGTKHV